MSEQRVRRVGRRAGASGASRDAILDVARRLFAKRGFRGTTTRAIAQGAGVDAALIHHFFGTKARLFKAAIDVPDFSEGVAQVIAEGDGAAERLVRLHVEKLFLEQGDAIGALIRAAVGDPGRGAVLRKWIESTVVASTAGAIRGRDAELRAELLGAQIVGLFLCRHLIKLEPLASADARDIVRWLAPALEAIVDGDGARRAPQRRPRRGARSAGSPRT